ncbi:5-oxoprolinase subunit PxpB [Paenibacillus caui]|uniref:5-oxoprolinase subunit PxpB n=1 Tax=Paenibacillus caui TaxID=2873927 RepID=UPI001CAA16A5|nr:5-oxoprolinase subunit PxpB [Paenibacillus caui]
MKIIPLGDSALVVKWGESISLDTHQQVRQLSDYLQEHPFKGMIEYVPAFASVTIYYDGLELMAEYADLVDREDRDFPYQIATAVVTRIMRQLKDIPVQPARVVEIPVCYGGDLGPDLDVVAKHNGLSTEEVIDIHTSADYLVYMLGFAPGFAYLGGMSERIAAPRRETPRLSIPAGTVGIAGGQTGVYPIDTPGGWQLIGKTPTRLFIPKLMPPTLLMAGDIVRFYPISRKEFDEWEGTKP